MEIKGSVALVTGGGNGIGEAVVKHLVKHGAKVAVVDMVQKNIDRVVKDVKDMGGEVAAVDQVSNATLFLYSGDGGHSWSRRYVDVMAVA